MRDHVTTILDATGLLAIAAGVTGGTWQWVGPWAMSAGGVVVIAGSMYAARDEKKPS
jgi:hypothetical protein